MFWKRFNKLKVKRFFKFPSHQKWGWGLEGWVMPKVQLPGYTTIPLCAQRPLWTHLPTQGLRFLHAGHLHLQPAALPGLLHHHEGKSGCWLGAAGPPQVTGWCMQPGGICFSPTASQLREDPPDPAFLHCRHRCSVGCRPVFFLPESQQLGGKRTAFVSWTTCSLHLAFLTFLPPSLHGLIAVFLFYIL